jgi:hypothetical protein
MPKTLLKRLPFCLAVLGALFLAACHTQDADPAQTKDDAGPLPPKVQEQVQQFLYDHIRNPDSAQIHFEPVVKGRFKKEHSSTWLAAWKVKVWVNAMGAEGEFTGPQPYWFFFRKGDLANMIFPNQVPESDWKNM